MTTKLFVILFFCVSLITTNIQAKDKINANEILNNHLLSIGTKEKRDATKNQIFGSSVQFIYKGSPVILNGTSVFASQNEKNLWGMVLNSNDYPQDKFSFNGEKTLVSFTTPGSYSVLGDFILSYKILLKEGLLGGVYFSSWTLNNVKEREAKINFAGTKKINSTDTYVLEYMPKGGSELEIKMFFDQKTFRHLRTEYFTLIAARQGSSIDNSARQNPDRFQVIEEFDKFQNMGGLNIPSNYKISYSYQNNSDSRINSASQRGGRRTMFVEWEFNINSFSYNQDLDPNSFNIETK